jgi:hypothetical protein
MKMLTFNDVLKIVLIQVAVMTLCCRLGRNYEIEGDPKHHKVSYRYKRLQKKNCEKKLYKLLQTDIVPISRLR